MPYYIVNIYIYLSNRDFDVKDKIQLAAGKPGQIPP